MPDSPNYNYDSRLVFNDLGDAQRGPIISGKRQSYVISHDPTQASFIREFLREESIQIIDGIQGYTTRVLASKRELKKLLLTINKTGSSLCVDEGFTRLN